jgi:uncharacterized membrane protein YbhN (UPF0104 family)
VARLVLSAAILTALLAFVPLGEFRAAAAGVGLPLWLGTLAVFGVGHVVGALKWRMLLGGAGAPLPAGSAVRLHFAGLFANLFLPSVAGGDLVRAGLAMRSAESRTAVALGSLIDRVLDTAALGGMALLGGLAAGARLSGGDALALWIVLGVLAVGAAAGLGLLVMPPATWLPARVAGLAGKVREAGRRLLRRPGVALAAFAMSLAVQGTFVLLNTALGRACGIEQPIAVWFFAWPLAKLTAMVPISLAGIGVREAALAAILGRFTVAPARAVAQGLVWESILVTTGALGGIFHASRRESTRG